MNIWFNHWFSTAVHLIRLMRAAGGDLRFLGTSTNPRALYREAVDVWEDEPEFAADDDYVQWALTFCRTHDVDVFVPRRRLAAIVEAREAFAALGVRLFAPDDGALVHALDDKGATYKLLQSWGLDALVPPYRMVHSLDAFRAAVDELQRTGARVCYKLAVDEGATTFRVMDDRLVEPSALWTMPGAKVTRPRRSSARMISTSLCSSCRISWVQRSVSTRSMRRRAISCCHATKAVAIRRCDGRRTSLRCPQSSSDISRCACR